MEHLPSAFSRNSENIHRSREDPYAKHIRQVNIIQPPNNENAPRMYQSSFVRDDANPYLVPSSDHQLPKLNQETYFSNNYIQNNMPMGAHKCKKNDYLYPISKTYMNYFLNNCDDTSISHLSNNQHSLFSASNLEQVTGGQQSNSNSLPFSSNVSDKPDMFINSIADNLAPSSHGVYSQFGSLPNDDIKFTTLVNNIEPSKPHISPIKKLEKKQTKLLYSDVLNRAVSNEKPNVGPIKDNIVVKEKVEKNKNKKIERRKSFPCTNNSPEHYKHVVNPVSAAENNKDITNKIPSKGTPKCDSSSSEQDDLSNVQNTPTTQKPIKVSQPHKTATKRETFNKDNQSISNQSSCDIEDSPQKQRDTFAGNEKTKSANKKSYKQPRSVKSEKSVNQTYKKNKIRKKKKSIDFEAYLKNWQELLKKVLFWFWALLWDIAVIGTNVAFDL